MLKDLKDLYVDLTESSFVSVTKVNSTIEIRIVARWFDNMSQVERMDYLWEAIRAIYPEALRKFKIKFVAISLREMN